jgi:hypothetical protein
MNYREAVEAFVEVLNSTKPFNTPFTKDRFDLVYREIENTLYIQVTYETEEGNYLLGIRKNYTPIKKLNNKIRNGIWKDFYKDLVRYSIVGNEGRLNDGNGEEAIRIDYTVKDLLIQKYREDEL